ncbi:MAG: hypothetical protein PWQ15_747 [Methanobacterium sp.]|jgi:archaellum biogenesis ATPase FlaH|nr:hypothetical protein [Methanobacterium sp.]MDI6645029.1 MEDS domain-containing protein [Methanobacteriaceae archaeon]
MKKWRQLYKIEDLKPGNHLCCIYETDEEYKSIITSYIQFGLQNNEKILCIVEDNNIETVLSYLKEDAKDIDHFLTTGQLSILSVADLYLEGGNFDPDRMIKKLQRKQ